jgi:hypothetical protein
VDQVGYHRLLQINEMAGRKREAWRKEIGVAIVPPRKGPKRHRRRRRK